MNGSGKDQDIERELGRRIAELGYELVELERAGSKTRPILRLRIDREGAEPGAGITVDECARVSRSLEPFLDEDLGGRYVIEVSSPGVERPLVRARDFERFAGREIALKGYGPLAGRGRRIEGELLGLETSGEDGDIRLRLADGDVVVVPRSEVARAHLVFRWNGG
ncbi:MAG: ribosome maturation factor RimP [Longimicrobiales bacterium]